MTVVEHFFDSREAMIDAVYKDVNDSLSEALQARDKAALMVSGGSSPAPIYRRLSDADFDWSRVAVALVDERWVDRDHDKSNESFIASTLLQNKAQAAQLVGMKNASATAKAGLEECEKQFQQLPQPFDVTILGMGSDGHTASLFPHAEGLQESLSTSQLVSAIEAKRSEVTGDCIERMTLSLAGILNSRRLLLLISGEEKLATYRQALAGDEVADMPIRAIFQQKEVDVIVYWAP